MKVVFGHNHIYLDDKRKISVLEEKKVKYVCNNPNKKELLVYRVDGGLFSSLDGHKCDYLICIKADKRAIFIELKGSDLSEACKQLLCTISLLSDKLEKLQVDGRVVIRKVRVPDLTTTHVVRLKTELRRRNGMLRYDGPKLTEEV